LLRAFVRHPLALLVLCGLGCAPLLWFALRLAPPPDGATARRLLMTAWVVAATAWLWKLALVAAVAPVVRAAAAGERISQRRLIGRGIVNAWRMALPMLVAVTAIAIGTLALVVPGLVLIVLLALTGASTERGLPQPLVDSVARVRARWWPVAAVVMGTIAVDLAIAGASYLVLGGGLPAKPSAAQLVAVRDVARATVIGCAVLAPVTAILLAALHTRHHGRDAST
jgi:hypothetical protein